MGVDEENYTITEPDQVSQSSSPENMLKMHSDDLDYVDIEGGLIPGEYDMPPKQRRGRGRPKKKSATLEEGTYCDIILAKFTFTIIFIRYN